MNKLEVYIAYLKMILNSGTTADDTKWSDQALYFLLINIRAGLIIQKHNKNKRLSAFNYQDIPCVTLTLSTIDECDCVPEDLACKYLKSTIEIPEILMGRSKFLGYITDMMGNNIDIYDFKDIKYDKYSLTKANTTKAFIRNKRLFIVNNTSLEKVAISAIFYSPEELGGIECGEDGNAYDPYLQDFPMEKDIADAMFKLSYEDILKFANYSKSDTQNNAQAVK